LSLIIEEEETVPVRSRNSTADLSTELVSVQVRARQSRRVACESVGSETRVAVVLVDRAVIRSLAARRHQLNLRRAVALIRSGVLRADCEFARVVARRSLRGEVCRVRADEVVIDVD